MWSILDIVIERIRLLPMSIRRILGALLFAFSRSGDSRISYGMRALGLGIRCGSFGGRLIVGPGVYVISPESLSLGRGVSINHLTYVDASGGVSIDDGVRVGNHCTIVSGNHDLVAGEIVYSPIALGEGSWIGAGVRVLAGVTVGEGATIGAGAVVTRSIPDGVRAVGVPARILE